MKKMFMIGVLGIASLGLGGCVTDEDAVVTTTSTQRRYVTSPAGPTAWSTRSTTTSRQVDLDEIDDDVDDVEVEAVRTSRHRTVTYSY